MVSTGEPMSILKIMFLRLKDIKTVIFLSVPLKKCESFFSLKIKHYMTQNAKPRNLPLQ